MPLLMASEGDVVIITRVMNDDEIKRHIENLGFVPGAEVRIIAKMGGNLIVNIKESRIAINMDMARKILF